MPYCRTLILTLLCLSQLLLAVACSEPPPKLRRLFSDDVIVALGDSLTSGVGATPETSYPADLERILGRPVVNAGIPGEETSQTLLRLSHVLETYQPRLVIVCIGGNDLLRKRPEETIKNNLEKIIRGIQATGAQIILIGVPEPSLSLTVPAFYQALGKKFHIPVQNDILPTLYQHRDYRSDYVHFNAAGYQALAEAIADLMKQAGAVTILHH